MAVAIEGEMRPMTELRVTAHVNTALSRALTLGLYAMVEQVAQFTYTVPSESKGGVRHTVLLNVDGQPASCSCEANDHLPFCKHRAAVTISLWVEAGYEVELGRDGRVYRTKRELASPLAYDPHDYEALLEEPPPLTAYEQHPEPLEPATIRHPRFEVLNDD